MKKPIAVIDVGSNSIKMLIANFFDGKMKVLADETIECRISRGMYGNGMLLESEAMHQGVEVIRFLSQKATDFQPDAICIVGTSALRDASNADVFAEWTKRVTGLTIKILSGAEEAELISLALRQEPLLQHNESFYSADLGGGSLELIFSSSMTESSLFSLNLGAVRMQEKFIRDKEKPIGTETRKVIKEFCRKEFDRTLPAGQRCNHMWGTGGAFTISRLISATEQGVSLLDHSPVLSVAYLSRLEEKLASLSLAQRTSVPGLPPTRADIFPVALSIVASLAEYFQVESFYHSLHNLRVGLAARWS